MISAWFADRHGYREGGDPERIITGLRRCEMEGAQADVISRAARLP